jgi:RHS repeat-associated protein
MIAVLSLLLRCLSILGALVATVIQNGPAAGVYFPAYDGNGNLMSYVRASDGVMVAQYEYGPFDELLRATGPMAQTFNHLFSTKYFDWETGLSYYGHRYYSPTPGRWPNRDPIEERSGINLYGFVHNNPVNVVDADGRVAVILKIGIGAGIVVCIDAALCAGRVSGQLWEAYHEVRNKTGRNPGQAGTPEDALKHCVASCNLAKSPRWCLSASIALWVTNQHEDEKTPDSRMDVLNNRAGNQIGRGNPADCFQACQSALQNGKLTCLDANNNLVPCTPRSP